MEKEKQKNIIIGVLIGIIIILVFIISVFFYKNINSNEINNEIKQEQNNNIINDVYEDDNNINNNEDYGNDTRYDENDFIRQTKINLVDEPNCTGNSSSLVANIEDDGNISISQNGGASIVTPGNAKYLFRVGKLACDVVSLYYITNDNELYVLDNPRADKDQTATKVIDDEVIEFLGTETKEVEDGYNHYIKVLLKNGNVEYVNYLTTVK